MRSISIKFKKALLEELSKIFLVQKTRKDSPYYTKLMLSQPLKSNTFDNINIGITNTIQSSIEEIINLLKRLNLRSNVVIIRDIDFKLWTYDNNSSLGFNLEIIASPLWPLEIGDEDER